MWWVRQWHDDMNAIFVGLAAHPPQGGSPTPMLSKGVADPPTTPPHPRFPPATPRGPGPELRQSAKNADYRIPFLPTIGVSFLCRHVNVRQSDGLTREIEA